MEPLQAFLLLFTSLAAFTAALSWTTNEDRSAPLIGYFAFTAVAAGSVLFKLCPWDEVTYTLTEIWRAVLSAMFALECGWRLGLPRRLWRENLFRACCLALCGGVFGLLLGYFPKPLDGQWALRGLIGMHMGVAFFVGAVWHQGRLSTLRRSTLALMAALSWADASNIAALEAGPFVKDVADWLGVTFWCALCLSVCINAAASSKPSVK